MDRRNFQTLDEEFAAREAELLPPTHVEGGEKDPQLGDYPDIQTSNQLLPAKGWWDPQARRNYGDPVSRDMFQCQSRLSSFFALGART